MITRSPWSTFQVLFIYPWDKVSVKCNFDRLPNIVFSEFIEPRRSKLSWWHLISTFGFETLTSMKEKVLSLILRTPDLVSSSVPSLWNNPKLEFLPIIDFDSVRMKRNRLDEDPLKLLIIGTHVEIITDLRTQVFVFEFDKHFSTSIVLYDRNGHHVR